jgi:hypothetical protein
MTVTTLAGDSMEAHEPVTLGPNFLMFKSSEARTVVVAWSAIASVVV